MSVIPRTGTEAQRAYTEAHATLAVGEVHSTTDQERFFLRQKFVGPFVRHPDVATEAAMLALNATSSRGCWPGDSVLRTDQNAVWTCVFNNGELVDDWEFVANSDTPIDGGNFTESIIASDFDVDGGTFT